MWTLAFGGMRIESPTHGYAGLRIAVFQLGGNPPKQLATTAPEDHRTAPRAEKPSQSTRRAKTACNIIISIETIKNAYEVHGPSISINSEAFVE
jgi:hypothetical protein